MNDWLNVDPLNYFAPRPEEGAVRRPVLRAARRWPRGFAQAWRAQRLGRSFLRGRVRADPPAIDPSGRGRRASCFASMR
jgi:hypothetical protein